MSCENARASRCMKRYAGPASALALAGGPGPYSQLCMFTAGPTFTRVPSRARAGGVTTSLSQTITITITLAGATGAAVAQHVIQHKHAPPPRVCLAALGSWQTHSGPRPLHCNHWNEAPQPACMPLALLAEQADARYALDSRCGRHSAKQDLQDDGQTRRPGWPPSPIPLAHIVPL